MNYTLPRLPYPYDALEPFIDAKTMEIHHSRHHQGYIDKLKAALKDTTFANDPIEKILGRVSELPPSIRNNGGGTAAPIISRHSGISLIGTPSKAILILPKKWTDHPIEV